MTLTKRIVPKSDFTAHRGGCPFGPPPNERMQLTWLTGAPNRPGSVHRRACGRCGLGSPATQLMRAVRPPPPGEVSKPSWWVVVRRLPDWLAKAISGRNAASRFCYRSLAAQPNGKAAESRSAAYVCLGDGALGRRLAACILAKSVDLGAAGLAFLAKPRAIASGRPAGSQESLVLACRAPRSEA